MEGFLSTLLSTLILLGMTTGLYNPRKAEFVAPPPPQDVVYDGPVITIIEDGASDYVIVRAADAIPAEITAAAKLQGFLEQISGFELPIVTDGAAPRAKEIVIGDTNRYILADELPADVDLGKEGFIIRTVSDKIIIAGGKTRGTLYGVYDFLEKFLGCRWYSKHMKVIPQNSTVAVPEVIGELEIPAFEYRALTVVQQSFDIDSALANRVNSGWSVGNAEVPLHTAEYGGHNGYVTGAMGWAIMPEDPSHPNYNPDHHAKGLDGNPLPETHGEGTNPCFSHPGVLDLYEQYIRDKMAANPATECLSIACNDSYNVCHCLDCRQAYLEECGTPLDVWATNCSGAHFRFLNALCERITPDYPDLLISTFAYGVTFDVPTTPLHPNAMVFFAPIGMCYVHAAGECEDLEGGIRVIENYKAWLEICDNLAVFEYPVAYNHWSIPYPIWDNIQTYWRMYKEDGSMRGVYNCSSATDDTGFYQMTGYIYAKLMWDPFMDMEDIYNSFLPHYYGEGWQYIREYLRFAQERSGQTVGGVTYHSICVDGASNPANLIVTDNQLKYIDCLWKNAKKLTAESNHPEKEKQLINMRRAELSWRIWKADNFRGEFWFLNLFESRPKRQRELFDDILELGIVQHSETGLYVSKEDFDNLRLDLLWPRYWSWRVLGRDLEGQVNSIWDLLMTMIF